MKKLVAIFGVALMLIAIPAVLGVGVGTGVGINMSTPNFVPQIWMDPDTRIVLASNAGGGGELVQREQNYAFEGEKVMWDVVVWDRNGKEKISDVHVTVGPLVQGTGNPIEANCAENDRTDHPRTIGARDEAGNPLNWDPLTMQWYTCILTVETPYSMHGEYWITAEVEDISGGLGTFDENEYWFFNPGLDLAIIGNLDFGTVYPGQRAYSDTILVKNVAEEGAGVRLEMFISGTDFYDPFSSPAKCPTSNVLSLSNFDYYASNGNYDTNNNPGADAEGYDDIPYETGSPNDRDAIIIDPSGLGNTLTPGSEMAITLRLDLPLPCNGNFVDGEIFFWGEAI